MQYLSIRIAARWASDGRLPGYTGSTFRGTFGHVLKRSVCVRDGDCPACHLRFDCAYSVAFETPPPPDRQWLTRYPSTPHPFVFRFPDGGHVRAGDVFTVDLTLLGEGIGLLPYFIHAIHLQGERGLGRDGVRFSVGEIRTAGGTVVKRDGEQAVTVPDPEGELPELPLCPPSGTRRDVALRLITPCKLVAGGKTCGRFHLSALVGSLLRRYSMLQAFHGDGQPELDFRAWKESAAAARDVTDRTRPVRVRRYSNRQGRAMEFHGLLGSVSIGECPEALARLLAVGEIVHAGKATAFGFGAIRVIEDRQPGER